jgi:hypothetical protein
MPYYKMQIAEDQRFCPICKRWSWRGIKLSDDYPCFECKDTFEAKVWMAKNKEVLDGTRV